MSEKETPRGSGRGKGEPGKRADRAPRPAVAQDVVQRFTDAYWHYVAALQQLAVEDDLQQRIGEAYKDYARAAQATPPLPAEARDRVMRAYGAMMSSIADPRAPFAPAAAASEPQRELLEALEAAAAETSARRREAHEAYAKASLEVPSSLQERADEAYGAYVQETARGWAEVGAATLAPEALLAISQTIAAAAAARAASQNSIQQTRLAASALASVEG